MTPDDAHTQTHTQALLRAVSRMLGMPVIRASYEAAPLHGGTLGDVRLVQGIAKTAGGSALPFRIVQKTQKRWERPGDPASWRREYDLYRSNLGKFLPDTFRWPKCCHTEEREGEIEIWMEYVEGISGARLSLHDLALAAGALGSFQASCHAHAEALRKISCLSDAGYMQRDYAQWSPDTVEYQYLRSARCALPEHLKRLLIDTQSRSEAIFEDLRRLPQALCHRDYWTENIFVQNGGVIAIDWDCAGWGAIGEDIASLIADETEASQIGAYYKRLVPAYCAGLREGMELPPMEAIPIREMILIKFGYRLLQQVMFAESPQPIAEAIRALEQIAALP
ncbi:MAG: aminoglycoside phosphotransferase family protein [Bacillota bacterium]